MDPLKHTDMNPFDKVAVWIVIFALLAGFAFLGVIAWGFIEVIQWLTSK